MKRTITVAREGTLKHDYRSVPTTETLGETENQFVQVTEVQC